MITTQRGRIKSESRAVKTMTYALYSGGTSVRQRLEAMEAFENLMLKKEAQGNAVPISGDKN